MATQRLLGAYLAAVVALGAAACGGDDKSGGGGGGGADDAASLRGQSITAWTNEFQPDRLRTTQDILAGFTRKTGVKVKLVAVPEDQLATLTTNASAAGKLPDVVMATAVADSQAYAKEEIFDPEAAQEVVDKLGPGTFSKYPVRSGDSTDPQRFAKAWGGLQSGVDRKAPLDQFYSEESIKSLGEGVQRFQRWAFPQGQGALVGALSGQQPVAKAVAAVVNGKDPAQAAKDAQSEIEEIKSGLQ